MPRYMPKSFARCNPDLMNPDKMKVAIRSLQKELDMERYEKARIKVWVRKVMVAVESPNIPFVTNVRNDVKRKIVGKQSVAVETKPTKLGRVAKISKTPKIIAAECGSP